MYMATGVNGRFQAVAAQHAGPGNRNGGGGVTVPHLDEGAVTALARKSKKKTATFPLVTGVGFGDFTAMVFSFTGLGLLLNQASELFTLFKWVGAFYLIYLGIQLWRMPVESTDWSDDTPMSQSPSRMLWHAWITTALNPKSIVFFLAFLPQFINPESDFLIQVSVLGTTFWVLAVINALGYAWLASRLSQKLRNPIFKQGLNRVGGSLLAGAGGLSLITKS